MAKCKTPVYGDAVTETVSNARRMPIRARKTLVQACRDHQKASRARMMAERAFEMAKAHELQTWDQLQETLATYSPPSSY